MSWKHAVEPLRIKNFRYQFIAEASSFLGNAISPVALTLGILQGGGSPAMLGIVLAAGIAPAGLFVLVGGVWADRWPRRKIIITTDSIHAVTQLALAAMFITGNLELWALIAVQLVAGAATAFDLPASTGLTTQTVDSGRLQRANALLSLARSTGGSVGPLVASALVLTVGPGWALAVDGLTFLLSALLLARLKLTGPAEPAETRNFLAELRGGFKEVTRRSWVWSSMAGYVATHFCIAAFFVLGPTTTIERRSGVIIWAFVVAALSLGEVIGDLLALRLSPQRPMVHARIIELLFVPLLLSLAIGAPVWVLLITAVIAGISITFPDALWFTALQQHLPPHVLSRVSSYDWFTALTVQPIGYATVAALSGHIGVGAALAGGAALIVITRLAALSMAGTRNLRSLPAAPAPSDDEILEPEPATP